MGQPHNCENGKCMATSDKYQYSNCFILSMAIHLFFSKIVKHVIAKFYSTAPRPKSACFQNLMRNNPQLHL